MSRRDEPATKGDLDDLEERLKSDLDGREGRLRTELRAEIQASERRLSLEIAGAANAMIERCTDLFRAADDRTKAVGDRVTVVERRLDEHVADRSAHGRTRRSR